MKNSIAFRLSLTVVVALILAIGAMVFYVDRSSHSMADRMSRQAMTQLTANTANALEDYLRGAVAVANALAGEKDIGLGLIPGFSAFKSQERFKAFMQGYADYWAMFSFDLEGKVTAGFNAKGESLAGADRSSRDYAKAILGGAESYITPQVLKSKSGGGVLIFGVARAVRNADGELLGGVAVFPLWEKFTEKFIDPVRVGENGYPFIMDATGTVLAHAMNKGLILKETGTQDFVKEALARKDGVLAYDWEGRTKVMAFDTVPETGWVVCMSAYQDDLLSTAREQRIVLGIMAVVLILLLVGMITVVTRRFIITPLLNIEHFTHAVAQGDFGAALEGSFQCELGDLKDNVGHMVAEIKSKLGFSQGILDGLTLPCAVVDMEQRVTFANQALLGFMEREGSVDECRGLLFADLLYREEREQSLLAEAMRDGKAIVGVEREYRTYRKNLRHVSIDTAPLYDLDGHMLGAFVLFSDLTSIREQGRAMQRQNERINETAQQADTIAQRLAAASEELSAQVAEAAQGADVQRERTTETATAMEEMNATVLEVARNASSAAENADRARSTAENGLSVMEELLLAIRTVNANAGELRASMEGLGEQAQAIGSVMNVINDIADQTNLLALNAAIEAARAGEAGRGFAVVADEVRKLAEKTMAATREVGSAIQAIQDGAQGNVRATETAVESVNRSTELAEQSGKALEEIVAMVEQTADQVRSIATASEEQSATSEEINTATEEINRISAETSDTMQQSTRAIQELAELAGNLERLMAGMCAGDDCGDTGKTGGNGASRGDSGHAAADVAEED